ncbi:MAG: hypothetical protein RIE59_11780, partial [Imperialibacter sp.]
MKNCGRTVVFLALLILSSCKLYKQDIMFKMDDKFTESDLAQAVSLAEKNYHVKKDDYLRLDVFTNGGERIVDPNFELRQGMTNNNMQNTRQFV